MVCPEEEKAWDDQTGEELDWGAVIKAREEEIREVHKHQVYEKVPVSDCWDKTGKAPIKTRWIDINKGDKVNYLINRPSTFSRGKCLLRLLSLIYVIIPHGICLYLRMVISGVLAFVMFWVVLFTGRYPAGIHEFQVGTLRWAMRVAAYLSMMSDKYPPFSGKH